ncbi:MAG: DUF4130 domain-containing protein [Promethearchaeota archaeon]|nr:MAG: DUF4130 domain-containing protein [Candidatus Lokiarchaeota archaeon]
MDKNCQKDPMEVIGRAKGYSHEELIQNLPRHNKFSPTLISQIKKIPEVVFRNSGTSFAKKINRMMREIGTEAYRAKQFTRTDINDRGVLYGVVLLKHKVMDKVLNYFHERWRGCIICLFNEYDKKTSLINEKGKIQEINLSLKEIVDLVSKDRPIIPYFKDIQFSGAEIFETLYKSQFILERENQTFFKKMIPDKCFELPGMRAGVEKRFRNKNINDYL